MRVASTATANRSKDTRGRGESGRRAGRTVARLFFCLFGLDFGPLSLQGGLFLALDGLLFFLDSVLFLFAAFPAFLSIVLGGSRGLVVAAGGSSACFGSRAGHSESHANGRCTRVDPLPGPNSRDRRGSRTVRLALLDFHRPLIIGSDSRRRRHLGPNGHLGSSDRHRGRVGRSEGAFHKRGPTSKWKSPGGCIGRRGLGGRSTLGRAQDSRLELSGIQRWPLKCPRYTRSTESQLGRRPRRGAAAPRSICKRRGNGRGTPHVRRGFAFFSHHIGQRFAQMVERVPERGPLLWLLCISTRRGRTRRLLVPGRRRLHGASRRDSWHSGAGLIRETREGVLANRVRACPCLSVNLTK
ncbi:hypothetical protein ACGC1H_001250 [Rhizoctonia solani]